MSLRDLPVVGCVAAIGFAVAQSVASVASSAGPVRHAAKTGRRSASAARRSRSWRAAWRGSGGAPENRDRLTERRQAAAFLARTHGPGGDPEGGQGAAIARR